MHGRLVRATDLKAKIFALGEHSSHRGLAVVINSGVWTLEFKIHRLGVVKDF